MAATSRRINTLCLTLLYTPVQRITAAYVEQRTQDWGRHEFVYASAVIAAIGERASPIGKRHVLDNRCSPSAPRRIRQVGRQFSLLRSSSDQVMVRTVKLAEDNDQVIVRLQELNGTPARNVRVSASADLKTASQVNGLERAPNNSNQTKMELRSTSSRTNCSRSPVRLCRMRVFHLESRNNQIAVQYRRFLL
jgi:alpha-mannosidase